MTKIKIGFMIFVLTVVLLMTSFGCSSKTINPDDYSLEDYPDIPTIGHSSLTKYKKFRKS